MENTKGIQSILTSYVDEMLNLCNGNSDVATMNTILAIGLAIGMLVSQLFCLPCLTYYVTEIILLAVGLIVLATFIAFGILLFPFNYEPSALSHLDYNIVLF